VTLCGLLHTIHKALHEEREHPLILLCYSSPEPQCHTECGSIVSSVVHGPSHRLSVHVEDLHNLLCSESRVGARGIVVAKSLCYKPERRVFDER
jgi:hypothetical protein